MGNRCKITPLNSVFVTVDCQSAPGQAQKEMSDVCFKSTNLFLIFFLVMVVSVLPHVEVAGVLLVLQLRDEVRLHPQEGVPVLER